MAALLWGAWGEQWALEEKVSFDGTAKTITVHSDVTSLNIRSDVYSAWVRWTEREPWAPQAMRFSGGDPIPGGETGLTFFVINGWKLIYNPSAVAVAGVLYSADYDTAYWGFDGNPVYPATVSALVNSAVSYQNVVTGDLSAVPASVWGYGTRTLTSAPAYDGPSAATIAAQVWDTPYADHKVAGTFGKLMDTLRKANLSVEGTVNDPGAEATTTVFKTNVSATSGAYDHQLLLFTTGPLMHEARPIDTYASTNGTIVLQEPLTQAPANGAEFVILVQHVHPMHEIADEVILAAGTTPIAANIKKVNDVTVTGTGQLGNEWGPV